MNAPTSEKPDRSWETPNFIGQSSSTHQAAANVVDVDKDLEAPIGIMPSAHAFAMAAFVGVLMAIAGYVIVQSSSSVNRPAPYTFRPATSHPKSLTESRLPESKRREVFFHLVETQDSGVGDEQAYSLIAKDYGISEKVAYEIALEGASKGWSMPKSKMGTHNE